MLYLYSDRQTDKKYTSCSYPYIPDPTDFQLMKREKVGSFVVIVKMFPKLRKIRENSPFHDNAP